MTKLSPMLALAGAVAACPTLALAASSDHQIVAPQEVEWAPGPASLPPGAESAVLYGDPSKEGLFALRLKLPANYVIPPHTHPRPEIVTVISGAFAVGMGKTADRSAAEELPSGGFFAFQPGMAHYAFTEEETIIQLNSMGPWTIDYIDPDDDPRS